ncbi:MAG: O-antigen ligase family protein [Ignavibacteriales bacterium]|nr:O-antigen ligase family protein [Ignavibacteriales bacterium]
MKNNLIQKIDQAIWWGLIAFCSSMIFSIAIVQIIVGLLSFLWIVRIIVDKKIQYISTPLDLPYIIFIAARIISVVFSINQEVSLPALYKEIPFYIIYFIVTRSIEWDDKKIRKILIIMIVSSCIASVVGISKVLLGIEPRANSTTGGYSTLGMYLTVIISITLALGKSKSIFPKRWFWWSGIALMSVGLLLTLNRTHWGVAAVIFLVVGIYRERIALAITTIFATAAVLIIPPVGERFNQLIHFAQNTSGRDVIWQGAFQIIFDKPLTGFGPRTFEIIFPLFNQLEDKLIASWHCDYLQVYMESGLPGILSYLWLIGMIYFVGIKNLRSAFINQFQKDLTLGIVLGMSAFFMTGIVGGFIIDPITSLLFRFLLGLLAVISIFRKSKTVSE